MASRQTRSFGLNPLPQKTQESTISRSFLDPVPKPKPDRDLSAKNRKRRKKPLRNFAPPAPLCGHAPIPRFVPFRAFRGHRLVGFHLRQYSKSAVKNQQRFNRKESQKTPSKETVPRYAKRLKKGLGLNLKAKGFCGRRVRK